MSKSCCHRKKQNTTTTKKKHQKEGRGHRKGEIREIRLGALGAPAKLLEAESETTKRSSKEACLQLYSSLFRYWLLEISSREIA